jgi:hypothetical protein
MFWWYKKRGVQIQWEEWQRHYEMAKQELARFRKVKGVKMKGNEILQN